MSKDEITKLVAEKFDAALKAGTHPKKFFITENGRGVVDGGDLYNAVLKDVLGVVSVALADIFATLMTPAPAKVSEKTAPAPAAKAADKPARVSTKK